MPDVVHLMAEFSPWWVACSAVATIVPSRELISRASPTTEKMATRCGVGAWDTSGAAVTTGTIDYMFRPANGARRRCGHCRLDHFDTVCQ